MLLEFIKDILKLILEVVLIFFLFTRYLSWKRSHLSDSVERNRTAIILVLATILLGVKVSEDALTGDSGPVDKAILLFIHNHVSRSMVGFFEIVTVTGSFKFFVPLLFVALLLLTVLRKWFEMLLLGCSAVCGGLVIYILKTITLRERPALWETHWYWGTSFPSGHTSETGCVATALTLCLSRIWPARRGLIRGAAVAWLIAVACSRLVLGVHWPTDVLAAACLGVLIPICIQFLLNRGLGRFASLNAEN